MNNSKTKRFAFIDVQNTEGTTSKLLGFVIDWRKTYHYLKEKWQCEKIFFYCGIQQDDEVASTECISLTDIGYTIRAKPYFIYKNKDGIIKLNCPNCKTEITQKIEGGVKWKSNCDVELSVDAENCAQSGTEFLVFTGDGDFEYLIRDVVKKGVRVYIISNTKKIRVAPAYFVSRFSTKLRHLINEKRGSVFFIDINDWKIKIKKD